MKGPYIDTLWYRNVAVQYFRQKCSLRYCAVDFDIPGICPATCVSSLVATL
jgi:hypothetical protein